MPDLPQKRKNPFAQTIEEAQQIVEPVSELEQSDAAPKPVSTKAKSAPTKKSTASASKKTTTSKTNASTSKTKSTKKTTSATPTKTKIDPKTGTLKKVTKIPKAIVEQPKVTSKKPVTTEKKKPVVKTIEPKPRPVVKTIEPKPRVVVKTIEPIPQKPEPIVRPTPKKTKQLTKEEKVLYKKLEEAFNYVVNLTWVIEERTMDVKNLPDLTLGELHVIEMVNLNNNKPMTLIAKKLKVTVGAMTIGVNRLVQKEYLLRTRDEMDRRVILLSVTPKGKKALKFHDKFHEDILGLVLESGVNLAQATKVMTQFASTLEVYYDPSSAKPAEKKVRKKK